MSIRFLVQGAQGVGKTTLIETLHGAVCLGYTITTVRETARHLIQQGISQGRATRETDYFTYLGAYASAFWLAEGDVILFDRSILDPIVFSRIAFGRGNPIELMGLELWHYIRNEVAGIMYIPIEFPLVSDGTRIADSDEQSVFDQELQRTLHEVGPEVYDIRGSISARREPALAIIQSKIMEFRNRVQTTR